MLLRFLQNCKFCKKWILQNFTKVEWANEKKGMTFLISVEFTDSHCCYKIFVKGVLHNGTFEWFHILTDKLQFWPFTVYLFVSLCVIYLYLPFFCFSPSAFLCAPMIKACQRRSFHESVSNKQSVHFVSFSSHSVLWRGTSDLANP